MIYFRRTVQLLTVMCLLFLFQPQTLLAQSQSADTIIVSYDMGGSIGARQKKIRQLRLKRQRVEIRGRCYSACTMYLGLKNVCVSSDAVLGFHGPRGFTGRLPGDVFDHWSRVMVRNLREPLQVWFMQRARHVKSGVLFVSGTSLIQMGYARCAEPA